MQPRKRKDEKRSQKLMIGAATIFVLITSIVGFVFGGALDGSSSQKVRYGDYSFTYLGGTTAEPWAIWSVKVDKERFGVYSLPEDLETIAYDSTTMFKLRTPVFYVSIVPQNKTQDAIDQAIGLVLFRFQQDFPRRDTYVEKALSSPPTNESLPGLEEWEVRDCTGATETVPVVMLRRAEDASMNATITLEGNCIIAEAGSPAEFLMLYDRILLGFLGVMP